MGIGTILHAQGRMMMQVTVMGASIGMDQGSDRDRSAEWRKLVMESIVEIKASSIPQFMHGLRGELRD